MVLFLQFGSFRLSEEASHDNHLSVAVSVHAMFHLSFFFLFLFTHVELSTDLPLMPSSKTFFLKLSQVISFFFLRGGICYHWHVFPSSVWKGKTVHCQLLPVICAG